MMQRSDADVLISSFAEIAKRIELVAHAITVTDAIPATVEGGLQVGCLTEAVMYLANNAGRIAEAIHDVAEAIREQ